MFDVLTLLLLLFAIGTFLLFRSKHERHFLFFMVRTRYFVGLIDRIAKISPSFWRFVADFAIIVSFSGLGAAYLSKYRKDNRNLDIILGLLGVAAVLIWAPNLEAKIIMLALLPVGLMSLSRAKNALFDFVSATVLISSVLLSTIQWYLAVLEGAFGLLAVVAGSLVKNALDITSGQTNLPGVAPIVPWIEGGQLGFVIPGLGIFVPVVYGVASLMILLIVHEFAHGILARVHKLDLKSTGLLTLGAFPIGAFVEPDEEKLTSSESIAKMRVYVMGSFANLALAVVSILLFMFMVLPTGGWVIAGSNITGIQNGTTIMAIDEVNLSSAGYLGATMDASLFSNKVYIPKEDAFGNKSIVNVTTGAGIFALKPSQLSGLKMRYVPDYRPLTIVDLDLGGGLANLLFWLYFFNLSVAFTNLLPIVPFDGGKMVLELLPTFNVDAESLKKIAYLLLAAGIVIILINAYPLLYMFISWLFELGP